MTARKLKISAILSYAVVITNFCNQLLLTPFLTRKLGAGEYGLYSVCASITSYLMLMWAGLSSAYTKYYFEYLESGQTEEVRKLNGATILMFYTAGFIAIVAGLALSFNPSLIFGDNLTAHELRTARPLLSILSVTVGMMMFSAPFEAMAFACERFIFIRSFQCMRYLALAGLSVTVLLIGFHSVAVMCVGMAVSVLYCIGNTLYALKRMQIKVTFKNLAGMVRRLLKFASFVFIQSLLDIFSLQLDKILVVNYYGTKSTGIYAIGSAFNNVLMQFGGTIAWLLFPRVNKIAAENMPESNKLLTKLLCQTGRIQFMMVLLAYSGLVFFGRPFIIFFAGHGYEAAYYIVLLLTFPLIFVVPMELGQGIIRAKNKHHSLILLYLISSFLLLILRIPLVKNYGIIGAAFGTSAALLVTQVIITFIYFNKAGGLNMIQWLKSLLKLLPPVIIPAIFGVGIVRFINLYSPVRFIASGILYTGVFCLCMWLMGMNEAEKDIFRKPVKGAMKKLRERRNK